VLSVEVKGELDVTAASDIQLRNSSVSQTREHCIRNNVC
jgi:hypothetical protein